MWKSLVFVRWDGSQCALGSKIIDNFACFRFRDAWVSAWVPPLKIFFCAAENAYADVGIYPAAFAAQRTPI